MTGFPHPYVIVTTDGDTIRTLHPPSLGGHRTAIEAALASILASDRPTPSPKLPCALKVEDAHPQTFTQRESAASRGYTGNSCQDCGSFAMKRTGVCETCEACGSTSGGCS